MQNYSDDFLGMCDPTDVEPDDISEANYHNYFVIGVVEDKENIENFPTNEVRYGTAYGGQNIEFTISVSGLLCETTSLLVRKLHGFHGSNSEKYFFQSFCASTKGTSFTLLYPEGAMFNSMFWSNVNENYYITGSITPPLLSGSCKEERFSDITIHVSSRPTNASSSTSSDYRYAIFEHD